MRAQWLQSCPTRWYPMDCSPQAPLSMGFSRQEYWRGLPWPPPEDLPNPGIKPRSTTLEADTGLRGWRSNVRWVSGKMVRQTSVPPFVRSTDPAMMWAPRGEWATSLFQSASVWAKLLQACLTLCNPMHCSPQAPLSMGFSSQETRTLEWVAISFSRESSRPRNRTHISYVTCISRQALYH